MSVLLDTCTLVYILNDAARLGPKATALIEHTGNNVYISAVSLLEIRLKYLRGKLGYPKNLQNILEELQISLLTPAVNEFDTMKIFSPTNKDPFDNLLIAIALANNFVFITNDQIIFKSKIPGLKLQDATK